MLIELLASLTAFQVKDLATNSALFSVLSRTVELLGLLLEFGVKLDPDGSFAQALADAQTAAQDQPNVLEVLKRFAELIR